MFQKVHAQKAINTSSLTGTSLQNGQVIEGAQNLASLGYVDGPLNLQNSSISVPYRSEW